MRGVLIPTSFPPDHALIVMNRRFVFNWAGEGLTREHLIPRVREIARNGPSSGRDKALLELVRGCSLTESRLEEYTGEATCADVQRFFDLKSRWYQSLQQRGSQTNTIVALDLDCSVELCRENRLRAVSEGVLYREFDGQTASIAERFLPGEIVACDDVQRCPIMNQGRTSQELQIAVASVADLCGRIRRCVSLLPTDAIIVTFPGYIDVGTGDVSDFCCYIDDSRPPLSRPARGSLDDALIAHKMRERTEVASPNYVKRYLNLSTYVRAECAPQHQHIGFKGALRWVVDFELRDRCVLGMIDVRIVHFGPCRIGTTQLGQFVAICCDFQDALSQSAQAFTGSAFS